MTMANKESTNVEEVQITKQTEQMDDDVEPGNQRKTDGHWSSSESLSTCNNRDEDVCVSNKNTSSPMSQSREALPPDACVFPDDVSPEHCSEKLTAEAKLLKENDSDIDAEEDAIYSCQYCPLAFTDEGFLRRHLKKIHGEDYCDSQIIIGDVDSSAGVYSSPSPFDIIKHSETRSEIASEDKCCKKCKGTFRKRSDLHRHMREVHSGLKPFTCHHCGKTFGRRYHLNAHLTIHSEQRPFDCQICDSTFRRNFDLQSHMARIHSGEKPFKCGECGKDFPQSSDLSRHMKTHTGEKPFKCITCGKCFIRSQALLNHILRMHTDEKPFVCTECDRRFTQSSDLRKHMVVHSEEKAFKCTVCEKTYRRKRDLKNHMESHDEGRKPLTCSVCFKVFISSVTLKAHMKLHTSDSKFDCEVCGKSFCLRKTYLGHIKTHTDREFQCDVCQKSFTRSHDLQAHLRVHSGEKPYECDSAIKNSVKVLDCILI